MLSARKSKRNSSSLYAASNSVVSRLERGPRRQLQPQLQPASSTLDAPVQSIKMPVPDVTIPTHANQQIPVPKNFRYCFICKQHVVICYCNKTNAPYQRFRQSWYSWSLIHYRKNLVLGLCWSSQTFEFPSGYWQARPRIFDYKLAVNYVSKTTLKKITTVDS